MKQILYISLLLLLPLGISAQKIDSLRHILSQDIPDSTRINTLFELANQLYLTRPETTITVCKQIYTLSQKNHDTTSLAEVLGWLGYLYLEIGETDSALSYNLRAAKLIAKTKNLQSLAITYLNIASIYDNLGQLDKDLVYLNKSLKIAQQTKDKQLLAVIYNNYAYLYNNLGEIKKAIQYWSKALEIQQQVKGYKGLASIYTNLANAFSLQKDLDKSIEYYRKSLEYYKKINDQIGIASVYKSIGSIFLTQGLIDSANLYYKKSLKIISKTKLKPKLAILFLDLSTLKERQKEYDSAVSYALKALELYRKIKDPDGLSKAYLRLGTIYFNKAKYHKALDYAKQAYKLSQKLGYTENKMKSARLLKNIYKHLGNYKKAYKYFEQEVTLRDSLVNKQNYLDLIKAQSRFEVQMRVALDSIEFAKQLKIKDLELQRAKAQSLAKKRLQWILIASLIALLFFSIIIFWNLHLRSKSYKLIKERNAEMQTILETLKEKNQLIEQQNKELRKYYTIIEQSPIAIVVTDTQGRIEYINPFFTKLTGYSPDEVIGKNPGILKSGLTPPDTFTDLWQTILNGQIWHGILYNKRKDGSIFVEDAVIAPIKNDQGQIINFVAIKKDITKEIKLQNKLKQEQEKLKILYKDLTDSIIYAKRIQEAILPSSEFFRQNFKDHFILYKPLNMVSGDFYWSKKLEDCIIVAMGDATGHGVPGAFVSLLGISLLNEIYRHEDVTNPAQMLDMLRQGIKLSLSQKGSIYENESRDGIDIALFVLNTQTYKLQYAGANRPLYLIHNGQLIVFKPDRQPAGIHINERPFTNHETQASPDDLIYLFSDGFTDQFGGPNQRKFTVSRLKKILMEIHNKPLKEQKQILEQIFEQWKGNLDQVDDVLFLGLKIL